MSYKVVGFIVHDDGNLSGKNNLVYVDPDGKVKILYSDSPSPTTKK